MEYLTIRAKRTVEDSAINTYRRVGDHTADELLSTLKEHLTPGTFFSPQVKTKTSYKLDKKEHIAFLPEGTQLPQTADPTTLEYRITASGTDSFLNIRIRNMTRRSEVGTYKGVAIDVTAKAAYYDTKMEAQQSIAQQVMTNAMTAVLSLYDPHHAKMRQKRALEQV